MRIDEIDLSGNIKVKGATAPSGKVISYSGTGLTWSTAPTGGGPQLSSYIKTKGYNYIIVETTTDPLANWQRLQDAYFEAQSKFIGTPSVDNRFTIICMPGKYDFSLSRITLDTSFIDIIGFSSNRKSVLLDGGGSNDIFQILNNVDTKLENVTLNGFVDSIGYVNKYLRWKNIQTLIDPFEGTFDDLVGEFEDIKSDGRFCTEINYSLNGIFKNIECSDRAFVLSNNPGAGISGTFSNITINDAAFCFASAQSSISGTFDTIKIGPQLGANGGYFVGTEIGSSTSLFQNIDLTNDNGIVDFIRASNGTISGTFRNITAKVTSLTRFIYSTSNILGTYEKISIDIATSAFYTDGGSIMGDFSNISFRNTGDVFYDQATSNVISGTFENIEVGAVTTNIFNSDVLDGTFKNIKIKSSGGGYSFLGNSAITGTYEYIDILNAPISSGCFISNGYITANFKNINIQNADAIEIFRSPNDLNLTCENITITTINNPPTGPTIFLSQAGSVLGTYKNIDVGVVNLLFYSPSNNVNINLKKLRYNHVNAAIFSDNGGSIFGSYEDIFTTGSTGLIFQTVGGNDLNVTVKNVDIAGMDRNSQSSCFRSGRHIYGTYENIRIGNVTTSTGCFYTTNGEIDIVVDDLVIKKSGGGGFSELFSAQQLKGTFSNIDVAVTAPGTFSTTNFQYIFKSGTGYRNEVYCKNVRLGRVNPNGTIDLGGIFYQDTSKTASVYLENFVADAQIKPGVVLNGKIISSEIDQRAWSQRNLTVSDGTIIEKSNILGSASNVAIAGVHQSTHTIAGGTTPNNTMPDNGWNLIITG